MAYRARQDEKTQMAWINVLFVVVLFSLLLGGFLSVRGRMKRKQPRSDGSRHPGAETFYIDVDKNIAGMITAFRIGNGIEEHVLDWDGIRLTFNSVYLKSPGSPPSLTKEALEELYIGEIHKNGFAQGLSENQIDQVVSIIKGNVRIIEE